MEEQDEIRGGWKFEGGSRVQEEELQEEDLQEGEFGGRGSRMQQEEEEGEQQEKQTSLYARGTQL